MLKNRFLRVAKEGKRASVCCAGAPSFVFELSSGLTEVEGIDFVFPFSAISTDCNDIR
jgi:hypothetical protein